MTKISINQTSSATRDGHLKIKNGLPISTSLQIVADEFNTDTAIQLSTLVLKAQSSEQCPLEVESTGAGGGISLMDNTTTDADSVGIGAFGDDLCFRSGGSAAGNMRLTAAGDLGIGTNSPTTRLEVNGDTDNLVAKFISTDFLSYISFLDALTTSETSVALGASSNNLVFFTGTSFGSERMRIDSSGNVGIGTSSPSTKLTVVSPDAPNFDNDTHQGESIFVRGNNSSGDGNAQAVIAFGKSDGSSSRSGSAIASVQTDADTDKIGLGFYTSPSSSSIQTLQQQMLIGHNGDVGINDISSGSIASNYAPKLLVGGSIVARSLTTNESLVAIGSDATSSYVSSGKQDGSLTARDLRFICGTNEIARITSNGLTFNGDTAAANALDDYEEGTFTPTLEFGGGTTAIAYVVQLGKYTKVGNKVTCEVAITLSNKGTDTGDVSITGFPFTHVAAYRAGVSFANVVSISFADFLQGFIEGGQTAVFLREVTNAGVTTALNDTNFANNTTLYFSITYLSA